jgi:hypothetical protein
MDNKPEVLAAACRPPGPVTVPAPEIGPKPLGEAFMLKRFIVCGIAVLAAPAGVMAQSCAAGPATVQIGVRRTGHAPMTPPAGDKDTKK